LQQLRGEGSERLVEQEMNSLEEEKEALSRQNKVGWADLFKNKTLSRPLGIALGIMVCQQISGINAVIIDSLFRLIFHNNSFIYNYQKVIAYSTNIFQSVGLSGNWPKYGTIILGVVQVVMTVVCVLIIEKAGRKLLLFAGFVGMCISSFGLALARIFGVIFKSN
jgi:hypothetical protein